MWATATGGKQFGIKQRHLYEGLHISDLFGRVCASIRDKSQRDSFVRLSTQVEILQRLRKLVLKSVHKSMRKPLDLLIKVLVETGILEIITGNKEPIKIKANDVVTEDAVESCIRLTELEDTLCANLATLATGDSSLAHLEKSDGYKELHSLFQFCHVGDDEALTSEKLTRMFKSVVFPKGKQKLKMKVFGFLGAVLKINFRQDPKAENALLDKLTK
jgi:hypothetical protein